MIRMWRVTWGSTFRAKGNPPSAGATLEGLEDETTARQAGGV